jgi:tetratricopeptide (TPR) repeat protein
MKINLTLPSARTLLLGAAALVVAGILAGGGWYWHATSQQRAMAAYAEAMTKAQPAQSPDATGETRAAAQVAYLLGNLRFQSQQYPQARAAYELALAQGAPRTLRKLSRGGVAYTWEAEKNYPKAVEAFKVALEGLGPKDFYYEELLLGLGRTQELGGQKAEASATYRRAVSELPNSRRLDEIKARLAELGS